MLTQVLKNKEKVIAILFKFYMMLRKSFFNYFVPLKITREELGGDFLSFFFSDSSGYLIE